LQKNIRKIWGKLEKDISSKLFGATILARKILLAKMNLVDQNIDSVYSFYFLLLTYETGRLNAPPCKRVKYSSLVS
jgi:hypothetical protein